MVYKKPHRLRAELIIALVSNQQRGINGCKVAVMCFWGKKKKTTKQKKKPAIASIV